MDQVLIRAPPKAVFDMLCDPTLVEEVSKWRVADMDDAFGKGFAWEERRLWRRRRWTITAYDRRGLSFTATWKGVSVTLTVKKGGTGSSNVQRQVEGAPRQVARYRRTDGDRLESIRALWEG